MSEHATRTVFLTGATGFIGRHVVRELLDRGWRVRCPVRPASAGRLPQGPQVQAVVSDLLAPRGYTRQVGDCSAVIHLVGILTEAPGASFRAVHIEGTQNLVVACQKMEVQRFLHMSALGVRPSPDIRYFQSKHQAETLVRTNGLDFTIFRPSVVHGAEGGFIRTLVRMVRSFGPLAVIGRGRQRFQPVFVEDLARLVADALDRPQTVGKTYEVGGSQVVTYRELLDAVARAVRGRPRWTLPVPAALAMLGAEVLELLLRRPPVTREMIRMLLGGSACESLEPLERDFGFLPRGFDETFALYAKELSAMTNAE